MRKNIQNINKNFENQTKKDKQNDIQIEIKNYKNYSDLDDEIVDRNIKKRTNKN